MRQRSASERIRAAAVAILSIVVTSTSLASAQATFTKGLWFIDVEPTAARVVLETSGATELSLEARVEDEVVLSQTVATHSREGAALASFRLEGLRPGTVHEVVVRAGEEEIRGELYTAPSANEEVTFLAYGDVRTDHAAHRRVIAEMVEQGDAAFVLHTGDFVEVGGRPRDWETYFEIAAPLLRRVPIYPSLGNHELYGPGGRAAYFRHLSAPSTREAYYVRQFGGVQLIALDSNEEWADDSPQRQWLETVLSETPEETRFTVVVLHHGPVSSGRHGSHSGMVDTGVRELLRDGGVDVVLSGHDHMYERGDAEGLKYVVTGGGGAPLYFVNRDDPAQLAFVSVHHFLRFVTEGDVLHMEVVRVDGSTLERCDLQRGQPWDCEGGAMGPVEPGIPWWRFFMGRYWPWFAFGASVLASLIWVWRRKRRSE